MSLFWRAGYHGVNMNELSRVAGLNKATLYQHFTSKELLAAAAVNRSAQRTKDSVYLAAFAQSTDPMARLNFIYHRLYEIHQSAYATENKCFGCPFVNFGVELATTSEEVRGAVNKALDSFRDFYQKIVEGYSREHKVNDIQDTTDALMANMNGCLVMSKIERRPEAISDGAKWATRILLFSGC